MNIIKKLTLRHLKENKGRTIITTLGICVSVAMITAVFVSVASFMKFYGDASIFESGNQHAVFQYVNQEQLSKLENDDRIDKVGIKIDLMGNDAFRINERASERTSVGNIIAADKTALEMYLTSKMDGTMPSNEKEIAVEQSLIEKNNLDWKIGDTVTLSLGERTYDYMRYDENGEEIQETEHITNQYYRTGEEFTVSDENAQFKITGILHNNNPTRFDAGILRGISGEEKNGAVNALITLKKVNYKSLADIKDISKGLGDIYTVINKDYLESKFAVDEDSFLAKSLFPMGIVILVIIMIASVMLIYNSFGMSLSEKTRYLGMLGSVGATKKQKRNSVYFEGAVLGAVGIPLGIIGGIIGIGVTLEILGEKIISTGMLMGVEDSSIEFKAVVPLWVIVGIVLFSIITIFISAVIPARKASAITPVEALRQSTEFKIKAKNVKSSKLIRKIFGYEGELANKNLKRNGRKSKVITASIAVSVVLFMSVNYFCSLFMQVNGEMDLPYQIQVGINYFDGEKILDDVKKLNDIDDAYLLSSDIFYLGKNTGEKENDSLDTKDVLTSTYKSLWNSKITFTVMAIEDEKFNALCRQTGVNSDAYYEETENDFKLMLVNNLSRKESGAKVFNENAVGRRYMFYENFFEDDSSEKFYYKVQDLVDYKDGIKEFSLVPKNYLMAFLPRSVYINKQNQVFGSDDRNYIYANIAVETARHSEVCKSLYNYIEENKIEQAYIADIAESLENTNTILFVLQVFVYGFITLITMITIANIINTISTSIALRRKEFAMLKSVGTTQKGFYKMICLESLFYGLKALVFAIPVSLVVNYALNKLLAKDAVPFEIDFIIYACVILAVFLIVGFSMLYSINKIKKDSIIETLKQDIT